MLIRIDDPNDSRIELYRDVRERDLVGRGERFIAEGEVVLRVLLTLSHMSVESILLAEQRVSRINSLLDNLPAGTPVYVASQAVMDGIVGFPIHRGILAVGRRREKPSMEALLAGLPPQALVVGLIGLANHDNVGGIFRNAAGFGVDALLLDPSTCDPLYRKAIRVSVGGSLIVPFVRAESSGAMLMALTAAGFDIIALSPAGSQRLADIKPTGRTALLLGAEGAGLPPEVLRGSRTARIDMAGGFDSLNVATTSGIALYQLATSRTEALAAS